MKKSLNIALLLLLSISLYNCEKDDICPKSAPTTPLLNIEFFDISSPNTPKATIDMNVKAKGMEDFYFKIPQSSSKISIPLNPNTENISYYFVMNSKDSINMNTDTIRISYTVKDIFISRACGYRSEFQGLQANIVQEIDNKNWIKNIVINQNNVVNADTIHLYIYH